MKNLNNKPKWFYFLPATLQEKLKSSPNLLKVLSNIAWLFSDKALRMALGLFVGVWVARYLGPEQFGLLSYVMAFVALFSVIGRMGINEIIVRDLVKEPHNTNVLLGSAFVIQLFGGVLAFVCLIFAIDYVRPDAQMAKLMVVIIGFMMIFQITDIVKYWFESQVQSKYTVWIQSGVFLLVSITKIILIMSKAPLIAFAWVVFAESLFVAIGFLVIYSLNNGFITKWRIDLLRIKSMIREGFPLILSGLAIMFFMRIDQIMIGQILGDSEVGIYSAAVRMSEVWYFVPTAIVASVFPSIIEAKKQSESLYYQRLQKLYSLMVFLALIIAMPMTFLSDWLIVTLYGEVYSEAGTVLAIYVWAGVFVFLGVASGRWYILENFIPLMFYKTLIGAVLNVILNMILIPKYGIIGAAITTLCSYSFSSFMFDFLLKKTRRSFFLKINSMLLRGCYARW